MIIISGEKTIAISEINKGDWNRLKFKNHNI